MTKPSSCLFIIVLLLLLVAPVAAQQVTITPSPDPTVAAPYWQIVTYVGPGITFQQGNIINAGVPVQIIERTRVGNWVHVIQQNDRGETTLDGWVLTGLLTLSPDLRFSQIPVNTEVEDADPSTVDSQSLRRLYSVPVLPTIGDAMRDVYAAGQRLGNSANGVTKIGDSVVANTLYLIPMSQTDYALGPYDHLEDTIRFFGPSTAEGSIAARKGLSTLGLFDPLWADKSVCNPGESPLDCEYRLKKPAVALIMFGGNDVKAMTADEYGGQMRKIVAETIIQGIIPVLFTFSYDLDNPLGPQAVQFNLHLIDIADEYDVPLVNLWSAARALPEYGLEGDGIHLKNWGTTFLKYTSGSEAFSGVALYNLLSISVLDELRHTLDMG